MNDQLTEPKGTPKRPRGRKPLPPERKRTTFISVRVTDAEATRLQALATEHQTTVSELTRRFYLTIIGHAGNGFVQR
jgi:hypothetical protein